MLNEVKHLAIEGEILRFLLRKCYGGQAAQNDIVHHLTCDRILLTNYHSPFYPCDLCALCGLFL